MLNFFYIFLFIVYNFIRKNNKKEEKKGGEGGKRGKDRKGYFKSFLLLKYLKITKSDLLNPETYN